jgi:hypothetical protein
MARAVVTFLRTRHSGRSSRAGDKTAGVETTGNTSIPENSKVPYMQEKLRAAIDYALSAIAADVWRGLLETVGLDSEWWTEEDEQASFVVYLPANIDCDYVAKAVNLENLEAWLDGERRLHFAISPFYTTKDVDRTVLCLVKVVCQFTGLIDVDSNPDELYHRH